MNLMPLLLAAFAIKLHAFITLTLVPLSSFWVHEIRLTGAGLPDRITHDVLMAG